MQETSNPETLSPELIARIKAIQIHTQHLVSDVLAGEYESAFKGRGMEFEEVREYQPGDDVRHIDWNVTARMNAPFVKVHREERELTVMLLVDASSSGAFGTVKRLKQDVAAEAAALLAYTAVKSNDRVGLIIFSDRIEKYIPPKKGSNHIWRVIRAILNFKPEQRPTDLGCALEFLGKVTPRKAVTFVISDFLDEDYEQALRINAKRHDLTAITVTDPREVELPPIGLIEFEDAETGELILIDTSHGKSTQGFFQQGQKNRKQRKTFFRAAGVGQIDLYTDQSLVEPIVAFFRRREH